MTALVITSFFIGAAFAFRFPAYILFPVIPIWLLAVGATSAWFEISAWSIVFSLLNLEIGYFSGTVAQIAISTPFAAREQRAATPASRSGKQAREFIG